MSITSTQRGRNIRRVERGAKWLDRVDPGWADTVDLTLLDMAEPCRCVLGQIVSDVDPDLDFWDLVEGAWHKAANQETRDANLRQMRTEAPQQVRQLVMTHDEAVYLGFQEEAREYPDENMDNFNHLTRQWRKQINQRKGN